MMRRFVLATVVLLHGIGHASVGVWAAGEGPIAIVNTLWALAIIGYCSAALGMYRVPVLRHHWKIALVVATVCSMVLLILYGGVIGILGIPLDLVIVFVAFEVMQRQTDAAIEAADVQHVENLPHPMLHR